ncbi:MAG TPA: dephospho-CoA kinase [candidate division Zixibacteria bacterium]|nr:dephospho-CoA kinase [candidate division Zixibacteria bacterium]
MPSKGVTLGVTGQIGAGKSEAVRILSRLEDSVVVDADLIGRQVVENSPSLLKQLVTRFGPQILTPTGKLRRKTLARFAFADESGRCDLNALVHPFLLKELRNQVKQSLRVHRLVIVDAALLLDWNLDRELDLTLVIHASRELRLNRLAARGISREDALARQKMQLPIAVYRSRADRFILNNGNLKELESKLVKFHKKFIRNRLTNG